MGHEAWLAWEASLPQGLPPRERYTATLLDTLAKLVYTAPFPWALTGGTALQSSFPPQRRRYSTDLEIITPASAQDAEAWMRAQGRAPMPMNPKVLHCTLTPDGTLFVLHSYPPGDFEAASVTRRAFEHYPLPTAPPPEPLEAPLVSLDFLVATKLFALQERGRGGERRKDAYDLAVGLGLAPIGNVMRKLETYAAHRGRAGGAREIARAAGAWLVHFRGKGSQSLVNWLQNFVPGVPAAEVQAGLAGAVDLLSRALGERVEPTDEERCRFLSQELSPRDLAPIAARLGFREDPVARSDKMRDFVLETALPRLPRPLPSDARLLLEALERAAGP